MQSLTVLDTEVLSQAVAGPCSPLKALAEGPSHLFQVQGAGGHRCSLTRGCLIPNSASDITALSSPCEPPRLHGLPALHMCPPLSFSPLRGHKACWIGAHTDDLALTTSAKTLFPNKATWGRAGPQDSIMSFWRIQFNPRHLVFLSNEMVFFFSF